ncbi:hypothetical protein TWF730_009661 [Orbilia blumenaviensis]|uniref:Uncharacterized protein n=1 Tax=Orbilia blumenaviensis TaxID=1796055 RepID=A0AAV9USH7_9PEZI
MHRSNPSRQSMLDFQASNIGSESDVAMQNGVDARPQEYPLNTKKQIIQPAFPPASETLVSVLDVSKPPTCRLLRSLWTE